MSEAVIDDIVALLPPILQSLEALSFVARHLNPPDFGRVMHTVGAPDESLQAARAQLGEWPDDFAGLRAFQHGQCELVSVFKALRYSPRAQEALYPLARKFPPVSEYFLYPS